MKHIHIYISLSLLVSTITYGTEATTPVNPHLSFRSQGQDLARQKAGTIGQEYKADVDVHTGILTITPEYTQSFNNNTIAQSLFSPFFLKSCTTLNITGQSVTDRNQEKDLNAYWFYLPNDYEGTISFNPSIKNMSTDISFYWGMDEWVQGMYFRVHTPLTWTKWNLGACFKTTVSGTQPGEPVLLLSNSENYFCSKGREIVPGLTFNPLSCARFCRCSSDNTQTRFADIQADFGWNYVLNQDNHLGFFTRIVAPTGNKVKGEWLFQPIVGNGHHWELGGGLTNSTILWRSCENNKHIGFYLDANITHLFNTKQTRVFDLKNKPLSRYITIVNEATTAVTPIANLTSCEINVNRSLQADITAMFNFSCASWSCDLGYNFWTQSCEKFACIPECIPACCDSCNACTPCCGQCIIKNGNQEGWLLNNDNATISFLGNSGTPLVLTNNDIDYDGARTKGISHKLFGHINYSWINHETIPFVGFGGFTEFGAQQNCNNCSCCKNIALSQWGVWLKGGVSF